MSKSFPLAWYVYTLISYYACPFTEETCKRMVMIYEEDPIIIVADALPLSRYFTSTDIGREFVKTINFYIGSYVYVNILTFVYQLFHEQQLISFG